MVEVSIGLNKISEKEGVSVKEMNYPDLVDDRAEPKISIPIPIHSNEKEGEIVEAITKPVDDRIDDPKSESNQEHNVM